MCSGDVEQQMMVEGEYTLIMEDMYMWLDDHSINFSRTHIPTESFEFCKHLFLLVVLINSFCVTELMEELQVFNKTV